MKLKRDQTSQNAPAPNQIAVGELAINTNTGILYSKMSDGTVIKWLGVPVCETENQTICPIPVPEISFSDTTNFCCGGDSLTIFVSNLLVGRNYTVSVIDLITNSVAVIAPASQSLLPINKSDRTAIINININKTIQSIASLKVSIYENIMVNNQNISMLRSEKVQTICCNSCGI